VVMVPGFRRTGAALAALLAFGGASAGLVSPAAANASFTLTRVAGADRFATAAQLAGDAFPTSANAVIARGDGFADALGGAYLAGVLTGGAPVLLTDTASVPSSTKARLASMGVKTVYLLGGTAAISTAAEQDLARSYTVNRIAGVNRYDTAGQVARTPNPQGIGLINNRKTAVVVSGDAFPDALSAGPASFAGRFPILLSTATSLPPESASAISTLGIRHVVIMGGTAAVSDGVAAQINALGATTQRVAGSDRYATATAVADFELANVAGWSAATIDLATGETFADALAGGAAAGKTSRSIALTSSAALNTPTSNWLRAHASSLANGRVLGGTNAVSDDVVATATQAGRSTGTSSSGPVTATDKGANRYTFTAGSAPITVGYAAADTFIVDGKASNLSAFETALSLSDVVVYTAAASPTPARHEVTNQPPARQTGLAVAGLTVDGDSKTSTPSASDGGKFTLATNQGTSAVVYRQAVSGDSYLVNGASSSEAVFEQHYTSGDGLAFRPADAPTGSGQVLELTDQALAGAVSRSSVNTSTGAKSGNPAKSYAVLAPNGVTELDTLIYSNAVSAGTDLYFVNGSSVSLASFEATLNQIFAGTKTATATVERAGTGSGLTETHRLTTQ
jgi:putative cell wall-binding protein